MSSLNVLKFDRNLIAYLSTSAERNDVEVGEDFEEQLLRQLPVDRSLFVVAEDSTQFPVGTRSAGRSRSGGLTSGLDRSRSWILRLLMMASVIVSILEIFYYIINGDNVGQWIWTNWKKIRISLISMIFWQKFVQEI